jgi:hypothetical protein
MSNFEPMEGFDLDGDELVAQRGAPSTEWLNRMGLFLHGQAKGPMEEDAGLIGLRLDSGDAGFVSLTKEQVKEVITTLQHFV